MRHSFRTSTKFFCEFFFLFPLTCILKKYVSGFVVVDLKPHSRRHNNMSRGEKMRALHLSTRRLLTFPAFVIIAYTHSNNNIFLFSRVWSSSTHLLSEECGGDPQLYCSTPLDDALADLGCNIFSLHSTCHRCVLVLQLNPSGASHI